MLCAPAATTSSVTSPAAPVARGSRRARLPRHPQLALFAAAYLVYFVARWVFVSEPAIANAEVILDLERSTGTQVERGVQRAFDSGIWLTALSDIYLAAQLLVLPASLVVLHHVARPTYRRLRDTVIATWAISIPIFAVFPVSPPRLAGLGFIDTVTANSAASLRGSSTLFYNPFAAVPSLHVGFAFAIGIAVVAAAHGPALKAVGLLWGPVVTLAVVATGNHYLFDVVAGIAVTGTGWWLGRRVQRAGRGG